MKVILWLINHAINLIYPNVCGICDRICKEELCRKCEIHLNSIAKFKIDKLTLIENDFSNESEKLYDFKIIQL